jgi:hypothetical protein
VPQVWIGPQDLSDLPPQVGQLHFSAELCPILSVIFIHGHRVSPHIA